MSRILAFSNLMELGYPVWGVICSCALSGATTTTTTGTGTFGTGPLVRARER